MDLKARYRGVKYLHETLKILPQKPEPIVIDKIAERLGETIGAIHRLNGLETQSSVIGRKNRPLGKDQNAIFELTFSPNCCIINISRWQTFIA